MMGAPPFQTLSAPAAPIDWSNVDTDQLIPVRFVRIPRADGFGKVLFHDLRFDEAGAERPNFVLNRPAFRGARILVAADNFGGGSSREQAVWSLCDYGIRSILATSFGDIFFNNAIRNGVLLIREDPDVLEKARAQLNAKPGTRITIDLNAETWRMGDQAARKFVVEPARKQRLLTGLDEIDLTRQLDAEIGKFRDGYQSRRPWLFSPPSCILGPAPGCR